MERTEGSPEAIEQSPEGAKRDVRKVFDSSPAKRDAERIPDLRRQREMNLCRNRFVIGSFLFYYKTAERLISEEESET